MNDATRRGFLAIAGTAAAAGTAVALVPSAAGAATQDIALPAGVEGSMAIYIPDLTKGEMILMLEDKEVTVADAGLIALLAQAFARG